MNDYVIKLNAEQLKNLKVFMLRTTMSGTEVQAWHELIAIINRAQPIAERKEDK